MTYLNHSEHLGVLRVNAKFHWFGKTMLKQRFSEMYINNFDMLLNDPAHFVMGTA